jgi:hypothetical protein
MLRENIMKIVCGNCQKTLFFHFADHDGANDGLVVHAIGLPDQIQLFRGSLPATMRCPHCEAAVPVPSRWANAVDLLFAELGVTMPV